MDNKILSLRNFIKIREKLPNTKVSSFCDLMQKVSSRIENEQRSIIHLNIDEIGIKISNEEIVLPDRLFNNNEFDKTTVGINTGVSVIADRKSTLEHKRASFALMILGWYSNADNSSVSSDIDVLENFDMYMEKVPAWLHQYFRDIFKNMNYNVSFKDYYEENYVKKIYKDSFLPFEKYNLNEEQTKRIRALVLDRLKQNTGNNLFNLKEQIDLDAIPQVTEIISAKLNLSSLINKPVELKIPPFHEENKEGTTTSNARGIVRVNTIEGGPKISKPISSDAQFLNNAANSFVLAVALVVALVAAVSVITFFVLKNINF